MQDSTSDIFRYPESAAEIQKCLFCCAEKGVRTDTRFARNWASELVRLFARLVLAAAYHV